MLKPDTYRIYVLRIWPVQRGGIPGWHISLENVATGKRVQFPALQDLFHFLEEELCALAHDLGEVEGV